MKRESQAAAPDWPLGIPVFNKTWLTLVLASYLGEAPHLERLQTCTILWVLDGLRNDVSEPKLQLEQSLDQLEKVTLWRGRAGTKVSAAGNQSLNARASRSPSLEPGRSAWVPYRQSREEVAPRPADGSRGLALARAS